MATIAVPDCRARFRMFVIATTALASLPGTAAASFLPPLPAIVAKRVPAWTRPAGLKIEGSRHAAALARRVRAAVVVGRATWGQDVCAAELRVSWVAFDDRAGVQRPSWRLLARAAPCSIEFSRRVLDDPRERAPAYAWPWFCTLVVHEMGHLAGHQHSADPTSVMYPYIQRVFPACSD